MVGGGNPVPVNELVGEELQEKLAMAKQLKVAVVPEASKKLVASSGHLRQGNSRMPEK